LTGRTTTCTAPVVPDLDFSAYAYTWQSETNRYHDAGTGRFVPNSQILEWRDAFLDARKRDAHNLTVPFEHDRLSIDSWQRQMAEIRRETFGVMARHGVSRGSGTRMSALRVVGPDDVDRDMVKVLARMAGIRVPDADLDGLVGAFRNRNHLAGVEEGTPSFGPVN
jgi:hypothetical protein